MRLGAILIFLIFISCRPTYDLLVKNGQIYDGLGRPAVRGDVAIKNHHFVKVGGVIKGKSKQVIDASGMALAPGFIDLHAHIEPISLYPDAKSHVMQGVTTALGGPDGGSPLPIGAYLDSLLVTGIGLNVGYLIGHNTVRNHVMGLVNRQPTDQEMEKMQRLISVGMQDGAFGISTGLKYLPGAFASTEEVIGLSKIAAAEGGIYTSHLREEGLGLLDGVAEAILIAREADMTVVLTHHKAIGQPMWGSSVKTLAMVDEARKEGLDVRMDQYPYTASHTGISIVIPAWALEGGIQAFSDRCQDKLLRDSIRSGIIYNLINDRGGNDLRRMQFSKIDWKPDFLGKTLHDVVIGEGKEPTIENGAEMIIEIQLHRGANCIYHVIDSADVANIMQHPMTMIASDGRLTQMNEGHPHPRAYGTFPRVLGHYARDLKIITLTEAIRKMTSLPAETLGLTDRGIIAEKMWADLVIFDPVKVIDRSTFTDPHQFPDGIEYVIINGVISVDQGDFRDSRSGQVLRKAKQTNRTKNASKSVKK
ncbi:MAG: D-aminoacylase [Saprospiraceae bacterium]|nr:D-aminoacylase [Saprospiraceae bacterium]